MFIGAPGAAVFFWELKMDVAPDFSSMRLCARHSQLEGASEIEQVWLSVTNACVFTGILMEKMMYATDARSTINLLTVIERLKIKAIGVWHLSSMTPGVRDTITGWRNP